MNDYLHIEQRAQTLDQRIIKIHVVKGLILCFCYFDMICLTGTYLFVKESLFQQNPYSMSLNMYMKLYQLYIYTYIIVYNCNSIVQA